MRAGGVKAQAPRSPLPSSRDPGAVSARPGAVGRGYVPGVVWRYASSNARGDFAQPPAKEQGERRETRVGAGKEPGSRLARGGPPAPDRFNAGALAAPPAPLA